MHDAALPILNMAILVPLILWSVREIVTTRKQQPIRVRIDEERRSPR